MRVLVCGGRAFSDAAAVYGELDRIHRVTPISCIIEGGAAGADYLAARWSAKNDLPEHARFSADWVIHGKAAGPIRNQKMIDDGKPQLVVAFPGGPGTADMVRRAEAAKIEVRQAPARSDTIDCAPVFIATGKGDQWEGSCPCGWWRRGTKAECQAAANGHRRQ